MRLYLAGPMTGIPQYNFPEFFKHAALLKSLGHEVHNPAQESLDRHGLTWRGSIGTDEEERLATTAWADYLRGDIRFVLDEAEGVAVLPGWERSKGASLEVHVAEQIGLPIIDARTGGPLERFESYEENPERQRAESGAVKDNRSKPRIDLIPASPLVGAGYVLGYGASKYKPNNWRLGLKWSDTFASLVRHLLSFNEGEDIDPESGLPHIDHAMCQLLFLSHYYHTGTGEDDRWSVSDQDAAKL